MNKKEVSFSKLALGNPSWDPRNEKKLNILGDVQEGNRGC